ncbi:lysozyme [Sphingobacterium multivorum]|uniref:lysozyme n=1 Tax=Sphingobacterium multivorum TaxID=28454 RepID=UPI003DA6C50D
MKTGKKGIDLIFDFETGGNLKKYLTAYWDGTGKVWTIGIGSTYYEDGSLIKKGDVITEDRARKLFENIIPRYEADVNRLVRVPLSQNQFDALVSLTYNVGATNLGKSTLLRKININPNDPTIRDEFVKWNRSGGKVLKGLTRRRIAEANLYFEK